MGEWGTNLVLPIIFYNQKTRDEKIFLFNCGAISWSCSDDYDDTAIWNEINNLKTQIEKLNADLTKAQTIVAKLESGKYVVDYAKTQTGCTLEFSDGSSVTLGTGGVDIPIIGIKESNGIYYWTLTTNGEETWLTIPGTTDRIPVSGKENAMPEISVDADGYWTVNGTRITGRQSRESGCRSERVDLLRLGGIGRRNYGHSDACQRRFGRNSVARETEHLYFDSIGRVRLWRNQVVRPDADRCRKNYFHNYSCMAELNVTVSDPVVLYAADGGEWVSEMPAQFDALAIKTVGGAVVTDAILTEIETNHAAGYSLDLSEADYESTVFRSYGGSDTNENLLSIVLPRNIEEIPDDGFKNCIAMTSCIMPEGLKKVGDYGNVFSGASALKSIEFPEGVEYLCKMMFYFAPMMGYGVMGETMALEEVVIPSTATDWQIGPVTTGSYWFFGCSNLKRIICKLETGSWGDFGGGMGVDPVPSDCVIYVPDNSVAAYKAAEGWGDFTIKGLSELN